jgi:hypothetical protein
MGNFIICSLSRDSSVGITTSLRAGRPRIRGSIPDRGKRLFSITSRPVLGPTQPPIQWILGAVSPRVKRPRREAGAIPPTSAEVKNGKAISPLPYASSWGGA